MMDASVARRCRRSPCAWIAGAIFFLVGPVPIAAQQQAVARIDRILDVAGQGQRERIQTPTERVMVRPPSAPDWQEGAPNLEIFRDEQILVAAGTLVRLEIRAGEAEGQAHLAADLPTETGPYTFAEIGGNDQALYEMRDAPEEVGGVELYVAQGSLALDWLRGRLALFAAGIRAVVSGTRLVLSTAPDETTATLHLLEGSVTFPDFPGMTLQAGQTALLRAGQTPVFSRPDDAAAREIGRAEEWTRNDVWGGRSFFANPWVYVAGAAGVLAGHLLLDGDDDRDGVVILRIPISQ